jgi:hypothetical protein
MLIIFNPAAGQGRRRRLARALATLDRLRCPCSLAETTHAGHAEVLARAAAAGGTGIVVAAGGDGTIAEVAGGLAGSQAKLGVLPLGTANVFAWELGIPVRPEAAARLLLRSETVLVHPGIVRFGGRSTTAMAGARLYDFGIAALALRLPVQDQTWTDFTALVNRTDQAVGSAAATNIWEGLLAQLRDLLGEALDRPTAAPLQEDYLITVVHVLDEPMTAEALQARVDFVPLLSGEERPLSAGARNDLLRQRFSYHPDDLAVITWDRAFILEPQRETDVADVLVMANAQLLEMRTYDEMLDEELPRMRAMVDAALSGNRAALVAGWLLIAEGRVEREVEHAEVPITHLIVRRLLDHSDLLDRLVEIDAGNANPDWAERSLGRADEVRRPEPGSGRPKLPNSRDFR